jgi:MFS family permease
VEVTYRRLLARPRVRALLAALVSAWISFGMVVLAILLAALEQHSYAFAGSSAAAFAVGSALLAPVRGRLVDRRGARLTLPAFATAYGAALVAFGLLARRGGPEPALVACALAAGAAAPPLVATTRDTWRLLVQPSELRAAYALTSLVGDAALVGAPALAGLLATLVAPLVSLAVAAVAALAAALVIGPLRHGESGPPSASTVDEPGLLRRGAFVHLLVLSIVLGAALGLLEVGLPAVAVRAERKGLSGVLLGAFSFGSAVCALVYGRRAWTRGPWARYRAALAGLALGLVPVALAPLTAPLVLAAAVAGAGFGAATVALFELIDVAAPDAGVEAMTWITTAEGAGIAAGSFAAGLAASGLGARAPLVAAPLLLAAGLLASLARSNVRGR